jgi:hypothetical protein
VLRFAGCKEGEVSCNTAGDPAEILLFRGVFYLVNLLNAKELVPGVAFLIEEPSGTVGPVKVECGPTLIEVKGLVIASLKETNSLVGDTTTGSLSLTRSPLPCDSNDTLCEKLVKEFPLEAKLKKSFERLEIESSKPVPGELSEMALVDD